MMSESPINIISTAEGPEAILSNFADTPFTLDGVTCASVEGFIQGLKEQKPDKQRRICLRNGFEAKRASSRRRNRRVRESGIVWWQGRAVSFKSEEYYQLIERGIRAKLDQNATARQALFDTRNAELVHDTGRPESPNTSLPSERFVSILMKIRTELLIGQSEKYTR
jgi:predicted NAD-dependent protein-ADP-ribosyltransferase YbiA (DUF1768 family)